MVPPILRPNPLSLALILAALAPAEPSGPDRAIAAAAASMEAQALQEINARESAPAKGDRRTEAYEAMSRSGEAKPEGRSLDVVA